MGSRARQTELVLRYSGRGGFRPGAGRPRKARRTMPHRRRPQIAPRHPVHVTLRVRDEVWNLRSRRCFRALARAFAVGKERFGLRLIHFSVQGNHLHLIVEVVDAASLSRGMQGLCVRVARGLNRLMDRRGVVFADHYHSRILPSPTTLVNAIAYVLGNAAHHYGSGGPDPFCSSAYAAAERERVLCRPQTWLLQSGWRRARNIPLALRNSWQATPFEKSRFSRCPTMNRRLASIAA